MESNNRAATASPATVALLAWILPGSGYLLIGQRGRAIAIGVTIIILFLMGLLIGGVRTIEVPGYDVKTGERVMVPVLIQVRNNKNQVVTAQAQDPQTHEPMRRWALQEGPLGEIRDKPWSVPQVLAGPMAIASGMWSVHAAGEDPSLPKVDPATGASIAREDRSIGALSHSRINEIGSLYLSVAGLLNLMAIIDSAWRASHLNEQRKDPA